MIGFIVATTGSFVWALAMMTGVALLGVFSYVVILGDVKRVEIV
jgi:ACS family D-galactonate transporter-like MFS transporter